MAAAPLPAKNSTGLGSKWLYLTGLYDLITQKKCNLWQTGRHNKLEGASHIS